MTLGTVTYPRFSGNFTQMPATLDAVYAFAYALDEIYQGRCLGVTDGSCTPFNQVDGHELLSAIRNLSFHSPSKRNVSFTNAGDISAAYDVFFVGDVKRINYAIEKVGQWKDGGLNLFPLKWKNDFEPIQSQCAKPCGTAQVRLPINHKPGCCWKCKTCDQRSLPINASTCRACAQGFKPDKSLTKCIEIPVQYFSLDGKSVSVSLALIPTILSILGCVSLTFIAVVFIKYRNTPLVKASGKELSTLLFIGIFLSFIFTFVAILKPCSSTCIAREIFYTLPLTCIYVSITVKTNRLHRIFHNSRKLEATPVMVRPRPQILIALGLSCCRPFYCSRWCSTTIHVHFFPIRRPIRPMSSVPSDGNKLLSYIPMTSFCWWRVPIMLTRLETYFKILTKANALLLQCMPHVWRQAHSQSWQWQ